MSRDAYTSTQKFLHWALFVLVVLLYALTYGEDLLPRGDPTVDAVWRLHISFGLLLAALVFWRVVLRGMRGAPRLPADMPAPERSAARVGHLALYALLVAIPVLGILLTWFRGDALSFFGLFTVPAPFAPDRATARTIRELHLLCANGILVVAGIHALAALYHHFVRRDTILTRMLPGHR
ncbi:cytochrome b [Mesorhizobium sp. VK23B]|uniref:Cytochrome b n=1 Tax=Mesorhizobium dulcispinae TaxID=3072316 RepID=A0ABU4XDH3_9HYPH|nr:MULTISPECIES: cytochrome b [unclassified Mesorhizobium]MDX8466263.1 cytochrome b [Mesorhizobium sp. VK23B]MDX8472073.1 cytochrome b [Mesorhizobium sp. VK23A]